MYIGTWAWLRRGPISCEPAPWAWTLTTRKLVYDKVWPTRSWSTGEAHCSGAKVGEAQIYSVSGNILLHPTD